MKKLLSVAVLCGFVGLGLTGCGDTAKSGAKTVETKTKADGSKTVETKMEEKKETAPTKP